MVSRCNCSNKSLILTLSHRIDKCKSREHSMANTYSTHWAGCLAGPTPSKLLSKAVSDRRIDRWKTAITYRQYTLYISTFSHTSVLLGEECQGIVVEAFAALWCCIMALAISLPWKLCSAACCSPRSDTFSQLIESNDCGIPVDTCVGNTLTLSQSSRTRGWYRLFTCKMTRE
jgi:hypothetical protein